MLLAKDPAIATKIRKMKQRVCWQHPLIAERNIDQTKLFIDDGDAEDSEFSFMVMGDSGTGRYRGDSPQRRVAEAMLAQNRDVRFYLHTGDVVYLVGSSEQYFDNFISPYREWLVGGENPKSIEYDRMVFKYPFLPTLGNHDYYDLPLVLGGLSILSKPLLKRLRSYIDLDMGWHGSYTGKAYTQAFIDYLRNLERTQLKAHLEQHYSARGGTCLRYVPGEFTRIPNRYYNFRYGGIDFFALDSNTFNEPQSLPGGMEGLNFRQQLIEQQSELEKAKITLLKKAAKLDQADPHQADQIDDISGEIDQLEEEMRDILKQLKPTMPQDKIDVEQLNWLRDGLITSWQDPSTRGRILYFHHPPYVTEATKWRQAQTLAIRRNLRQVLQEVQVALSKQSQGRPLVDLIINGHAHCLEYLRTANSTLADANIPCLVCGGSGYSLRRQRNEEPNILEEIGGKSQQVATSHLFIGRQGYGSQKRRPYSGLRIDVKAGDPPQFIAQPIVVEKFQGKWNLHNIKSIIL